MFMVHVQSDNEDYVDDFDSWEEVLDEFQDEDLLDDVDDMTLPFVFHDGDAEITVSWSDEHDLSEEEKRVEMSKRLSDDLMDAIIADEEWLQDQEYDSLLEPTHDLF